MKRKLLIIDDEANMRHMLEAMLSRSGYTIDGAENGEVALRIVSEQQFDFVLCDVRMPEMDGMEFLERAKPYLGETTVIMMSAYGTVDLALQAMKAGAYDYISKPFKSDEVLLTLKKAEEREALKTENVTLKNELKKIQLGEGFDKMVGASEVMTSLFDLAKKISDYDTTVLITGESGTGKELLAKGIHSSSPRHSMDFLAINCGSIPEHLIESELFGFAKGAFTGADKSRKGIFADADKGTLFLDEIGELPLSMQVKLLRVLQENEIRPVGTNRQVKIDVRIIAATSRDLKKAVRDGEFREDLFYRLNVMHLHIPPLRSRVSDIHLLCQHFIRKLNTKLQLNVEGISNEAMGMLLQYGWPGNVRELENVIERAMVMTGKHILTQDDLPEIVHPDTPEKQVIEDVLDSFSLKKAQSSVETVLIRKALEATAGNKSKAAELLELSYPSLLSKIKKISD